MQYAKIENNEIIQIATLQAMYPNTSFPDIGINQHWLEEQNLLEVVESQEFDEYNYHFVYVEPYIDNNVVKTFQIVELSDEDKEMMNRNKLYSKWYEVRLMRDTRLSESDFTQLPDVSLTNKEAWAIYRQQLRDITNQSDPFNLVWPEKP